MKRLKPESGQMLLVVVLTMIVALTVGLSVASRTITNLKISKQNEESQRAFQAAEAGIEKAIESASGGAELLGNKATYTTDISNSGGSAFLLNGGELVDQDVGLDVWLSDYPNYTNQKSGAITIYWGTSNNQGKCSANDSNVDSALSISLLEGTIFNPTLKKFVLDPCSGRTPGSTSAGTGTTIDNTTFIHGVTLSPPVQNGIIMRVIPVYNSVKIGISSTVALPNQGTIVDSTGQSGETVRKVQYFSSHPQVPLEIFPYSIISQ